MNWGLLLGYGASVTISLIFFFFFIYFCMSGLLINDLKGLQMNIRIIDEAIVISAALLLSFSAFVLQVIWFSVHIDIFNNPAFYPASLSMILGKLRSAYLVRCSFLQRKVSYQLGSAQLLSGYSYSKFVFLN